jgi:hypothetical protein
MNGVYIPGPENDLGYPVYIYTEGLELPKEGIYFVVSGNGLWMHKDTGICKCFVPVKNISSLDDLNATAEISIDLPKIPAQHVWTIKEFFRKVVEVHHSEAEVTLYYNKETRDYKIHVGEQTVTHSSVNYKREGNVHIPGIEDYLKVGTIHSHCDFGAFHSSTDVDDEVEFDGLHVTFGHNNKDVFSISASYVVNGYRTKIDPSDVLEGIEPHLGEKAAFSKDDMFVLLPIENAEFLSAEAESWMANVKKKQFGRDWGNKLNFFDRRQKGSTAITFAVEDKPIVVGDVVKIDSETKSNHLRNEFSGEYEVLACENGNISFKVNEKDVSMPAIFFQKVTHEKQS